MQLWYINGGAPVLDDRLPVTVQRLQAQVTYAGLAAGAPVIYRVEDAAGAWREPTSEQKTRVRAWLRRFTKQRGCSPAGTHPVHRVGVVFFRSISN